MLTNPLSSTVLTAAFSASKATRDIIATDSTGYFPTAVRLSSSDGVWERTGGNTFNYSFIGFALDAANQVVGILKTFGEISLGDDCSSETLSATVYLYDPLEGPFTDEPFQIVPFPELYGYRVQLD